MKLVKVRESDGSIREWTEADGWPDLADHDGREQQVRDATADIFDDGDQWSVRWTGSRVECTRAGPEAAVSARSLIELAEACDTSPELVEISLDYQDEPYDYDPDDIHLLLKIRWESTGPVGTGEAPYG